MGYLQHNQYGIKNISVKANVPDNDTARLMYYLNCVCSSIEYNDNNISLYRNCNNWSQLSNEEVRLLVVLCNTLSPDIFNDRVFFQSDALCGNDANKFYEISQVNTRLLVVQWIVVAGRTYRVNQIMTYKMIWMNTYYINPMKNLAQRLNNQRPTTKSRSSTCVIS